MTLPHFVSATCGGERCRICGAPATHKVAEEIAYDDPYGPRHSLTAYVCCAHFVLIVGPAAPCATTASTPAATDHKQMLSNLLARIHRDGGHREAEIGTEAAVAEADLIVANLNAAIDQSTRQAAPEAPAGYKLVPLELTPQMRAAGIERYEFACRVGMPEYNVDDAIDMAYDAMLGIAPATPTAATDQPSAGQVDELVAAADAVVERWHSRDWKQPHTAEFIARLAAAVGEAKRASLTPTAPQAASQQAGQWVHCTPDLINAGVSCAHTPRRAGDGTYSHDHWISHAPQAASQQADDRQHMTRDDMLALCAANPAAASSLPLLAPQAATTASAPARTQAGRDFDVEQAARAIESYEDYELANRLRHAWKVQCAATTASADKDKEA